MTASGREKFRERKGQVEGVVDPLIATPFGRRRRLQWVPHGKLRLQYIIHDGFRHSIECKAIREYYI